jgi:hypothetical protein
VACDRAALLPLAESIADGSTIDWAEVEARATGDQRPVIGQLRILSELALSYRNLYRSLPARRKYRSLPARPRL